MGALMKTRVVLTLCALASQAVAASCPVAGQAFIIKGFTGDTAVRATGGEVDPKWGCKFQVEDSDRELWWQLGADVVPVAGKSTQAPAVAASDGGEAPAPGSVFECTLPGVGQFTGAYFGIVDANTYRDFDARTGQYDYDPRTGVLRLLTGSSKGLRYQRQSPRNFRVLDDKGQITGGNCVLNTAKSIDGRW